MVEITTILLFGLALGASFFAAWTIGAGSTGSTPFAPAVGANAISIMRAAFVVGILGLAGAVLQGAAITETVGRGLVGNVTLSPIAAAVALTIAAIFIAIGVFKGYPIATAFAITGSVIGVGLAMGGAPVWRTYIEIGLFWVLIPFIVAPVAYITTKLLRSDAVPELIMLPLLVGIVGIVIMNMGFLVLGQSGEEASLALVLSTYLPGSGISSQLLASFLVAGLLAFVMNRALLVDQVRAQRWFLLILGALVAFSAGGAQVGLAAGPLLPLLEGVRGDVSITWVLVFGGIGILLGSWMVSSRMIKALSQDYSALGPRRSIGVLIPAFVIAQIGIFFGLPMSFNEIFVSAIAGTGFAVGRESISQKKMIYTVLAWVASLVSSFVVGFTIFTGFQILIEAITAI